MYTVNDICQCELHGTLFEMLERGDAPALQMQTGTVTADFVEGVFECYSDGQRWNGWGIPFFTRGVADRIADLMQGEGELRYNPETDAFEYRASADTPESDVECFTGGDIVVDGEARHVYSIGGMSWTWNAVEFDTLHGN